MAKLTVNALGTANGYDKTDGKKAWDEARRPHKIAANEHTGSAISGLFAIILRWLSDVGESFPHTEKDELIELAGNAIGNPFNRAMVRAILALYFCGYKSFERVQAMVAEYTVEIGLKAILLVNARDMVGKLYTLHAIEASTMRDVFAKLAGMLTGDFQVESKNHAFRVAVKATLQAEGYGFNDGHYLLDSQLADIIEYVKDSKYPDIRSIAELALAFNLRDKQNELDARTRQAELDANIEATRQRQIELDALNASQTETETVPAVEASNPAELDNAILERIDTKPPVETATRQTRNGRKNQRAA